MTKAIPWAFQAGSILQRREQTYMERRKCGVMGKVSEPRPARRSAAGSQLLFWDIM